MSSDSEDDSSIDSSDDYAPPWGLRPEFREMLAGGNKKLVLSKTPSHISDYYKDKVRHSCGCTYDVETNAFYATSPGTKGRSDGEIVCLDGDCEAAPVVVASGLDGPSAIAVYESGLSVCAVTNRGIFVFEKNEDGEEVTFRERQISDKGFHRGICTTARGSIISFCNGQIRMLDGRTNGEEMVIAEADYDCSINGQLFLYNDYRSRVRSNCCFMDLVNSRLAVSDLGKHVISLWDVDEEAVDPYKIRFVGAIDVAAEYGRGPPRSPGHIPLGKCAYVAGIMLDEEGWLLCADATGRTLQVFDDRLNFVMRVQAPFQLPYISGLYLEVNGHLMVCDRRSESHGLCAFTLDALPDTDGFAAAQQRQYERQQQQRQPPPPPRYQGKRQYTIGYRPY